MELTFIPGFMAWTTELNETKNLGGGTESGGMDDEFCFG